MTTKRCNKCRLVKSTSEFGKNSSPDGLHSQCKRCKRKIRAESKQQGLEILQGLAKDKGCCAHCKRPYSIQDWYFFEFDHIDPRLKQSKIEIKGEWVAKNTQEFFERVEPNLQLLCIKCHRLKTTEENKVGGALYAKKYGQSQSEEVIETDLTLFDLSTVN